jgi:toluene-4-monooxygenase system protein B
MNGSADSSGNLVPIYGFLSGDSLGLVVLVHENDAVEIVGRRLQQAANVRVASARHFEVHHGGRVLDLRRTVAEAGILPLDRVDVVPKDE